jgi:hypothetical protein
LLPFRPGPQPRRHPLDGGQLPDPGGNIWIPKDGCSRHTRRDLFEQFQPFRAHAVFVNRKPGGVAARPRKTGDQARANKMVIWFEQADEALQRRLISRLQAL